MRAWTKFGLLISPLLLLGTGWAQTYPTRPVTVIVPFAAGGNLDVTTRTVTAAMTRSLGQPFIIDNRAGAGGLIGHEAGARATADGYTLTATANGSFAITPKLSPKKTFASTDFSPIGMMAATPLVIAVSASGKYKSFKEFADDARAHPGKVSIGHSGNGTTNHASILRLQEALGTTFTIVPYKGSAPGLTDLLGGQIDAFADQLPSSLPHLQSQKLRALAVTTKTRATELPQVMTLDELGVRGFDISTSAGLLAPGKTPPAVVAALNQALNEALRDPAVQKQLASLGASPQPTTPQQFTAFLMEEDAKATELVKRGLLKAD